MKKQRTLDCGGPLPSVVAMCFGCKKLQNYVDLGDDDDVCDEGSHHILELSIDRRSAMGASTLHRLYPFRNYHPGGLSYNRDEYGRLVEQNIDTNYRVLTFR